MNDQFYNLPIYGLAQAEKQKILNAELNLLNQHHNKNCCAYNNLLEAMRFPLTAKNYAEQPFLVARLFKLKDLYSVKKENIFKTLTSSGTTSQQVSKIFLDADSAKNQSKVLSKIMQEYVGKQRLPMLIVDKPNLIQDKRSFSARGAGVQGFSFLGREHTYALNEDMSINYTQVNQFFELYQKQPVLIFGFTFMLWQFFIQPLLKKQEIRNKMDYPFEHSILFHSGGWKKLQQQAVTNEIFSSTCKQILGNCQVHNFYGMVEQTGTVYVECEQGFLHAPIFSDILIRDPLTLKPLKIGKQGLIQLLSILPTSYPGHSLLTEDLGIIHGEDNCLCGRKGQYFSVSGRLAQAETRGCSDTFSQ